MPVADPSEAILIPPICSRPRMIVREKTPSIAIGAVVFPYSTPGALRNVWAPASPVPFLLLVHHQANTFPGVVNTHAAILNLSLRCFFSSVLKADRDPYDRCEAS